MDTPEADDSPDTTTIPDAGGDDRADTDRADSPADAEGNGAGDTGGDDTAEDSPEPTPQSAALRRQQVYVGYAGALVAGAALGVGTFQQATNSPALAVLVALVGTGLVVWLVRKSIFPGESATG
jgi:hypothetical protein